MESEVETKDCPHCKKELAVANFDVHVAYCGRYLILCRRCNEYIHTTDKDHIKEKHCRVSCDDCGDNMERWELDGPHKESCPKRAGTCQFCEVTLSFDSLQEHIRYCGARTEPCSMCTKFVMIKEKENHMKEECTKRLVLCTRCQFEHPFDEWREHSIYCVANSKPQDQEIEMGKTKGSHPKKPYSNKTSTQGDSVPHDRLQENVSCYKCAICEAAIPSNEFRAHYEKCVENARRLNQFPSHKTVDKRYECESLSFVKTEEEPADDFSSSDDENCATKIKPSNNQLQVAKSQNMSVCESPNSADKKSDMDSMRCMFCGYQCAANELQEHLKQCRQENRILCTCGSNVLLEKFTDHLKKCPRRIKSCKLCHKKYAVDECENHSKLCPMAIVTCKLCDEDLLRHELESHSCTKGNRRNRVESKIQRLHHTDGLAMNQLENKDSEDGERAECCKGLPKHEKNCPRRIKSCKLCRKKCALGEFENHLESCPMAPVTCELCDEDLERHELESHSCIKDNRRNRAESKIQRLQQTDGLAKNQLETKDSEDGEKTECCKGLPEHEKNCPQRIKSCKLCRKKCARGEIENHLESCPMAVVTCELCDEDLQRHELESHSCTKDNNRMDRGESKTQRLQQTGDLTMNETETKYLGDKKTKCCPYCKRPCAVSLFKEHTLGCFMSPIKCKHCNKSFPVDEFRYHMCTMHLDKNRMETEGKQLPPTDDRVLVNALEDKGSFSEPSEHQQNDQVVQGTDLSAKNKHHPESNTEYSEYLENQNHGAKGGKPRSYVGGHVQMSSCVGVQNQNSVFGRKFEFCRFCKFRFDAEDLEKHLTQCDKNYVTCDICEANVKSKELENHRKLCGKKGKDCQFCEKSFPPSEIEQHYWSCPMSPVACDLCEKVFSKAEFKGHFCSADVKKQNRMKGSSQNLKHRNNREREECSTYLQQYEQNAETDESSDQSMEVDEDNVEAQSAQEGSPEVEASSSRTREMPSYSSDEGDGTANPQFNEDCFVCKVCCWRKPFTNLCVSVFKASGASVCETCVRNLKLLKLDFPGENYTSVSCPPIEDISENADAAEKKKGSKQEVKLCEFCDVHLPLDAWAEHTSICKSRPYECPKCGSYMLLSDAVMHGKVCDGQKLDENYSVAYGGSPMNSAERKGGAGGVQVENLRCQFCREVPNVSYEGHEKQCGMRFRKCNKCSKTVQLRYMKYPCESGHLEEHESHSPPDVSQSHVMDPRNAEQRKGTEEVLLCEYCDSYLPMNVWASHVKSCEQMPYDCYRCGSLIILGEKEAHDKICNNRNLHGGNSGGAQGASHTNSAGKMQGTSGNQEEMRACQYCGEIIIHSPIKAHEKRCGICTRECTRCGLRVQLRYMKIPCEYHHDAKEAGSFMPPGYPRRVGPHSTEEKDNSVNEKIQAVNTGPKACDDCHEMIPYAQIADHKETCEMRMENCLACDICLPHCQKKEHMKCCPGLVYSYGTVVLGKPTREENTGGQSKKQETKKGGFLSAVSGYLSGGTSRSEHTSRGRNAMNQHQVYNFRDRQSYPGNTRQPEPFKIPCEFCGSLCAEDELIIHQSGCRPDLFVGHSEGEAERHTAPQNRRRDYSDDVNRHTASEDRRRDYAGDDDDVTSNGRGRNNAQRDVNLGPDRRNTQAAESGNKVNIFQNHPLDNDKELDDVRFVQRNQRSSDSRGAAEINMDGGRQNWNNQNASRRGAEQPKNNCKECCQHLNRREVSQSDESGARPRMGTHDDEIFYDASDRDMHDLQMKMKDVHIRGHSEDEGEFPHTSEIQDPPRKNDDSLSFSIVAKAGRSTNSDNLKQHFDSEQGQQRHQTNRLHQERERVPNSGNLRQHFDSERGQPRHQTTRLNQERERVPDDKTYIDQQFRGRSNDQISSVQCKIFYKETSSARGNDSDMSLNHEMKQNRGDSWTKKEFWEG